VHAIAATVPTTRIGSFSSLGTPHPSAQSLTTSPADQEEDGSLFTVYNAFEGTSSSSSAAAHAHASINTAADNIDNNGAITEMKCLLTTDDRLSSELIALLDASNNIAVVCPEMKVIASRVWGISYMKKVTNALSVR